MACRPGLAGCSHWRYPDGMFTRIRSWFARSATDPRQLFASEVEALVRSLPGVASTTRVEESFAIDVTMNDGGANRIFLENHFAETREMSPDERRARLSIALSGIGTELEPTWEEARTMLVPVLRDATFGNVTTQHLPTSARNESSVDGLLRRPFAPFLDILAVLDLPTQMMFVSRQKAKAWNVSEDEVIDTALARFARMTESGATLYDDKHGPLWTVSTDDTYESSRLLIPGWLASFRGKVQGTPVAIVPNRSMVLVGGSGRPEMIARLIETAEREFSASTRSISPALYTVDDEGRVVPYLSADPRVRIAHEKLATFEYGQQKELLAASSFAEDVFVATYRVYQCPDGELRSTVAWTKTVDSLLPKATRITLVTLNEEGTAATSTIGVPWDAVADRLIEVPGVHPVRFRTGTFPEDHEIEQLRTRYPEG
jgi:uncharacterized protein YtpQ (UPF0354 family)